MAGNQISNDTTVSINIPFSYVPLLIEKVKSLGHGKTEEISPPLLQISQQRFAGDR